MCHRGFCMTRDGTFRVSAGQSLQDQIRVLMICGSWPEGATPWNLGRVAVDWFLALGECAGVLSGSGCGGERQFGERLAGFGGDGRVGDRCERLGQVAVDQFLALGERAGAGDDLPGVGHALLVEARISEPAAERSRLSRAGLGECDGNEYGPLALTQVVTGGLAGLRGVAEHAEHVV